MFYLKSVIWLELFYLDLIFLSICSALKNDKATLYPYLEVSFYSIIFVVVAMTVGERW